MNRGPGGTELACSGWGTERDSSQGLLVYRGVDRAKGNQQEVGRQVGVDNQSPERILRKGLGWPDIWHPVAQSKGHRKLTSTSKTLFWRITY